MRNIAVLCAGEENLLQPGHPARAMVKLPVDTRSDVPVSHSSLRHSSHARNAMGDVSGTFQVSPAKNACLPMVTTPIVRWTKGVKTENSMTPASKLHSGCGTDRTQPGDDNVIRVTE